MLKRHDDRNQDCAKDQVDHCPGDIDREDCDHSPRERHRSRQELRQGDKDAALHEKDREVDQQRAGAQILASGFDVRRVQVAQGAMIEGNERHEKPEEKR